MSHGARPPTASRVLAFGALLVGCAEHLPSVAHSAGGGNGSESGGATGSDASRGSGGGAASGGAGGVATAPGDAPTQRRQLNASSAPLLNPERGFYLPVDLVNETDLGWVRDRGYTLVHAYVRLDDYRDAAIDQSVIDAMNRGLGAARSAGIKVVLRFAYNFGPYPDSEPDASKSRILSHIAQLQPALRAGADVIAVMQAGFIGAWGEWHTSTNGLLDNPQDRKDILEALLDALPRSRSAQVRYPPYKEEMYGGPLEEQQAFSGGYAARTGHHNDCFLSSDTDVGTYPSDQIDDYKSYLETDTQWVPMGGETCQVHERNACATALAEMARLHFSYLNHDYLSDVVDGWQSGGCLQEIHDRLGYRLSLKSIELAPSARPGGAFVLRVAIDNTGFAAPFNPRRVELVLEGASQRYVTELDADPRRWLPGAHEVALRVRLPSDAPEGSYSLALRLSDPLLADRPDYAIQLANEGVWREQDGSNTLGPIALSQSAPGEAVSGASFGVERQ